MNASNVLRYSTLLATCILAVNCWGASFQNGSFETPQLASGASRVLLPGPEFSPGWNVGTNGRVELLNGVSTSINAVDGFQLLLFNSGNSAPGGTISQTFSTTVGQGYVVRFRVGRDGPGGGTMSLFAQVTSETGTSLGLLQGVAPATPGYSSELTVSFIAATPTSALTFTDNSSATDAVDVLLDNVSVIPVAPPVSALTNGSFESPVLAAGASIELPAGSTSLTGWTVGSTGIVSFANGPALGVSPVDGSQHIGFNGGNTPPVGSVSQTFNTTVGLTYTGSFYVARIGSGGGTMSLLAEVTSGTGAALGSLTAVAPSSPGYGAVQTFSFVATTTNSTLKFTDTSSSTAGVDVWLDNVSVTLVSECTTPSSGLVSWWQAEGNANDSADGNNGVLVNGATFAAGKVGQAFSLDGVNDFVSFADPPSLRLTNLTNEGWFNFAAVGGPRILVAKTAGAVYESYLLFANGGDIVAGVGNTAGGVTTLLQHNLNPVLGTWYHIAYTFDDAANYHALYIDGVLRASGANNTTIGYDTHPVTVGAEFENGATNFFFAGQMDEVALYNRALSTNEIQSIYNAGSAGKCPTSLTCVPPPSGLISWWQGEANANDAADSNNGVWVNGVSFAPGKVGQAFNFAGTNHVEVPASSNLNVQSFTIEAWIFPADVSLLKPIVEFGAPAGSPGLHLWHSVGADGNPAPGSLYANVGDAFGPYKFATSAGVIPSNQWSHVALTFDQTSGIARLLVNGTILATTNFGSITPATSLPVNLGYRSWIGGTHFVGKMDEVSIFNRALTAAEVQALFAAGSAGKCIPPQDCVPIPSGLISWWPGDGNANDLAGTNNATLTAGISFTNGTVGQAFGFNGIDSQIRFGNTVGNFNTNDFTIEFWIRTTSTRHESVIEKWPTCGVSSMWAIRIGGAGPGRLESEMFSDALGNDHYSLVSSRAINDGLFHHVAFARRGTNVVFYIDGILDVVGNALSGSISRINNTADLVVGRSVCVGADGTFPFTGEMDEISIYRRALSSDEIQAVFNAGSAGKCPPPLGVSLSINPAAGFYTNAVTVAIGAVNAGTNATVHYTLDGTAPSTNSPVYSATFTVTNTVTVSARAFVNGLPASEMVASTFRFWSGSSGCVAPPGAISWWTGDGTTDDVLALNPGVMGGEATFAPGFIGQAFSFGAEGDAITVANSPSLQLQTFTIEAWAKRQSTNQASLGTYGNGTFFAYGSGGYGFGVFDDGRLLLTKVGVSYVASTTSVTDTNWHHVVVTKSGTNVSFYIDGVGGGNTSYNTTFTFGSNAAIGATGDNLVASFYGLIDELAIYGRALSTNEVQILFSAGANGKCPAFGPTIITQPQNRAVPAGGNASFSVLSGGSPPLSYQWSFNGTAIANATNQTLALASVQSTNAGNYTVTVSNAFGSATSSPATLTVTVPPVITQQPQSQTVMAGAAATLTVGVTGSPPLTYQWRRNGIIIAGAASPTLVINNVQAQNAGSYTVRVSNSLGSVTSAPATLTVASGQFSVVSVGTNGVQLTVQGEAGANYTIEVSSDLSDPANWQPLATLLNNPQNWQFTDTTAPGVSQRFYRLLKSP